MHLTHKALSDHKAPGSHKVPGDRWGLHAGRCRLWKPVQLDLAGPEWSRK